ncbi:BadF/BadG/BcrA/BcrD ATPase family protein [Pseudorhodobacter ferrugineus]|uniref:BadF/BadG/BcrA/BcrD ATPase family protein n=1 Tax=Pseudorhodobacter ferrugineus TaxID=77008 RepID=UPI00138AF63F|nr:BadF/BadG/BcrA/BcrD ATPase family protein [Pseudorhodobacter ferrugineus]
MIGCDGGGTGCRLVIADVAGRVLAQGAGGPANVTSDFDGAVASLNTALAQAAAQLALTPADILAGVAHFGLAGVQSPQDSARIAAAFPFLRINVTEDRLIAVAGALGTADGVLIGLGTGTIIAAQRGGQSLRIGGWGLALSDDASGAWLGRLVLQRVLLAQDGMEPFTPLTDAVFSRFDRDPRGLVGFASTARPADYARFAPDVIAAAGAGDAVGLALMQQGAAYLARALTVLRFAPSEILCLTGGVGPHYAPYLPVAAQKAVIAPKGQAVDGALELAMGLTAQG